MAEPTFEMTPTTLARAIANGSARERRRAAKLLDDQADVALGRGKFETAQALQEAAEAIRSQDVMILPAGVDPAAPIEAADGSDEPELPDVHHLDDFAEGVALVQGGAHRRNVVGYNGASGHLRD